MAKKMENTDKPVVKGRKHTTITVEQRVNKVAEMLLSGGSRTIIMNTITKQYDISPAQVDTDITNAYKVIRSNYTQDIEDLVAKHIGMYYDNAERAKQTMNIQAANQSLQAIEKLLKLHSPTNQVNVQVNNNTVQLPEMSIEQIKELLSKHE